MMNTEYYDGELNKAIGRQKDAIDGLLRDV